MWSRLTLIGSGHARAGSTAVSQMPHTHESRSKISRYSKTSAVSAPLVSASRAFHRAARAGVHAGGLSNPSARAHRFQCMEQNPRAWCGRSQPSAVQNVVSETLRPTARHSEQKRASRLAGLNTCPHRSQALSVRVTRGLALSTPDAFRREYDAAVWHLREQYNGAT